MIEIFTSARVRILLELRERPHTISEIARKTGYSKTTISYHLARLNELGMVERIERGKWVYYRLTQKGVGRLKAELAAAALSFTTAVLSVISLVWLKLRQPQPLAKFAEKGRTVYEITVTSAAAVDWRTLTLAVIAAASVAAFLYIRFRR